MKVVLFLLTAAGLAAATWRATARWRLETHQLQLRAIALGQQADLTEDSAERQRLLEEQNALLRSLPTFGHLDWYRLFGAGCFYSVSLCCNGFVLRNAVRMFGVPCSRGQAIASQLLGHVGKYVPGKALVIVLRVWAIESNHRSHPQPTLADVSSRRVKRITAAVFVETLLMMSVGATMSGTLALLLDVPIWIKVAAASMAVVASVPLVPPLLTRVLNIVRRRRAASSDSSSDQSPDLTITWSFLGYGWTWCAIGWALIGSSVACVMTSIPWLSSGVNAVSPLQMDLSSLWIVATSSMALGMVLGFASLLPGGAGVRELATLCVLSPVVGPTHALLTVIAARILFLLVEMLLAGLSYAALIVCLPGNPEA